MPEVEKPILAVDVDGVVSLFGFTDPPEPEAAVFELINGVVHCISTPTGERLIRLREHYEVLWVSGWEAQTSELASLLGVPDFPYLTFEGAARFGSADWKLGPLGEHAAGRALAWVDDSFDERCYEWAKAREEPTLLIQTESHAGLLEVHVEALIGWARSLDLARSARSS